MNPEFHHLMRRIAGLRGPWPDLPAAAATVARWVGYATLARFWPPHQYAKRRPSYAQPPSPAGRWRDGFLARVPRLPGDPRPPLAALDTLQPTGIGTGPDIEQVHACHRWGWMLGDLGAVPAAHEVSRYVLTWQRDWSDRPAHPAWESYSISERIATVLLLASIHRGLPEAAALEALLAAWAGRLAASLEYYGPRTNNHILNDARALYMLGVFGGLHAWRDLGLAVLRHELSRLIVDGGLREGSSHYHLLVLRWLTEVGWTARVTEDTEATLLLSQTIEQVRDTGRTLIMPSGEAVLIGDVSPDISPRALRAYMTRAFGTGAWPARIIEDGLYHRGDWCRWHSEDAAAVWRLPKDPTPAFPTHEHGDLTSFVLHVHGAPVIGDPGRRDYTRTPIGHYGVGAEAHSVPLVDGVGPVAAAIGPFPSRTLARATVQSETAWGTGHGRVTIAHDGFRRLARPVQHRRTFELSAGRLRITDEFTGRSVHSVRVLFQLAAGAELAAGPGEGTWCIRAAGVPPVRLAVEPPPGTRMMATIAAGMGGDRPAGWEFPAYGDQRPSCTLAVTLGLQLPASVVSTFAWPPRTEGVS